MASKKKMIILGKTEIPSSRSCLMLTQNRDYSCKDENASVKIEEMLSWEWIVVHFFFLPYFFFKLCLQKSIRETDILNTVWADTMSTKLPI